MDKAALADLVLEYCGKFNVPVEYLFEILEDQKVTPMIRGKAMEFNAFLVLDALLPKSVWSVQKLNLNAQTGQHDEDISITHRRTGTILKVESKSAVRGSISNGKRCRVMKEPHFKVKCHRSRSNIELADSSNDRYSIDSFDVLITNPSNAIYEGNTVGEYLEVVYNEDLKKMLYDFYHVEDDASLVTACEKDWRFAIPSDIAEEGFIPRTPYVKLEYDVNWLSIGNLETRILEVVDLKRHQDRGSRRKKG